MLKSTFNLEFHSDSVFVVIQFCSNSEDLEWEGQDEKPRLFASRISDL